MTDPEIELRLAELFFLDTEPSDEEFVVLARSLNEAGWSRERVLFCLVRFIAPVAGGNLGYGIYPVIGEWAGFDAGKFSEALDRRKKRRAQYPEWWFYLEDRYNAHFLKRLGVARLLDLLPG